jgi:hypothetical protein
MIALLLPSWVSAAVLLAPDLFPAGNVTVLSGDGHLRSVSELEKSQTSDVAALGSRKRGAGTKVRTDAHDNTVANDEGADAGHEGAEDNGLGVHTLEGLLSGEQTKQSSKVDELIDEAKHAVGTTSSPTTVSGTPAPTTVAPELMIATSGEGPLVAQAKHALSLQSLARTAAIAAERSTIEAVALANASVLAHEEAWLQRGVANKTRSTADVAADLATQAARNATKWDGFAKLEEGNATREETEASNAGEAADQAAAFAAAKAQFALEKSIAANTTTSHR